MTDLVKLRALLAYDFGDESDHCIDLATEAGKALDEIERLRGVVRDALSMLGAPTDGLHSLNDRDIIKHTVAISVAKLKQIHATLEEQP